MTSRQLVSLQFDYHDDTYHDNLSTLLSLINHSQNNAIVVAPELCLTNFSYTNMDEAATFSQTALTQILPLSHDRIICFSMIEKRDGDFYNSAKILHKGKVTHTQDKVQLFKLGEEHKHFQVGDAEKIKIVEVDGLRLAILICFEIRFTSLWERVRGADVIMIPALWGSLRKEQFEAITKAMAILNQAFVIAADSANDDMAKGSSIITPFGEVLSDDMQTFIAKNADINEIQKMRRYMNIGLS